MKLTDIHSETDLRNWLTTNTDRSIEWIEPGRFGSSEGLPDCKFEGVGLELKYLEQTRKGIKWKVRPAQRRYHHMNVLKGGHSALLAFTDKTHELLLVRGDHIPLRDYAVDKESGCAHGLVILEKINSWSIQEDAMAMDELLRLIHIGSKFWRK